MADKGWIALHRNIRDHWVYQEKRVFSKYEAWLDLLMDANHQNNKFLFDGQLIEVNRGEYGERVFSRVMNGTKGNIAVFKTTTDKRRNPV